MKAPCEISQKLTKIRSSTQAEFAKKSLELISPYASDYVNSYKKSGLKFISNKNKQKNKPLSLKEKNALLKMAGHPFSLWLNDQRNFHFAKMRIVKAGIIQDDKKTKRFNYFTCATIRSIEFLFANIILVCSINANHLSKVIVIPKKWRDLIKKREKDLTLMSRNFELESEEQLFLMLFRRLKKSKGSVINSGKTRPATQMREFMTKKIIQGLLRLFHKDKKRPNLIANVALDITGIFYDSMKRTDAIKLVKKIEVNVVDNDYFMNLKVIDILRSNC